MQRSLLTLAFIGFGLFTPATSSADGSPEDVVIRVLLEESGKFVEKTLKSAFTEHERVYPVDGGKTFLIPAGDYGGSRMTVNFDHLSWVPRDSAPVRVRLTIHGVDDKMRDGIRIKMKCDKSKREDQDRGPDGELQHGSEFDLKYGTDGERAYYFVERNSGVNGDALPKGTYFKLERLG